MAFSNSPPPKILPILQSPLRCSPLQKLFLHHKPLEIYSLPLWLLRAWLTSTLGHCYCELHCSMYVKLCHLPPVWPWANHHLFGPQVPHLCNWSNCSTDLTVWWGLDEIMQVKHEALSTVSYLVILSVCWLTVSYQQSSSSFHHHQTLFSDTSRFQMPCIS